eukprot:CAMPEP_0115848796 /NCGR_PEP_ID=MMETSP0287-20121206/11114_1 /TAXON_ID=412157 /ORGANISM="Chrysochromulina rotalis, Strain UIO044" /LENGTH=117 /DNA_ID=CAMNT_0003302735 /DNA_START=406 /DNA_END=756 /DNA_ORIENTATION=-
MPEDEANSKYFSTHFAKQISSAGRINFENPKSVMQALKQRSAIALTFCNERFRCPASTDSRKATTLLGFGGGGAGGGGGGAGGGGGGDHIDDESATSGTRHDQRVEVVLPRAMRLRS